MATSNCGVDSAAVRAAIRASLNPNASTDQRRADRRAAQGTSSPNQQQQDQNRRQVVKHQIEAARDKTELDKIVSANGGRPWSSALDDWSQARKHDLNWNKAQYQARDSGVAVSPGSIGESSSSTTPSSDFRPDQRGLSNESSAKANSSSSLTPGGGQLPPGASTMAAFATPSRGVSAGSVPGVGLSVR